MWLDLLLGPLARACLLVVALGSGMGLATAQQPDPAELLSAARREALRIASLQSRAAALAELALRLDRQDTTAADEAWQRALECASAVDDAVASLRSRRAVTERLVRSQRRNMALTQVQSLHRSVLALPAACHRAVLLGELYPVLRVLDPESATQALTQAAEAAAQIPEALVRASALAQLAKLHAETDPKAATALAQSADQAWHLAEKDLERELAATELVAAWALLDWEHALTVTQELEDVQAKAQALRAAAGGLAAASLDRAIMAVRTIASPDLRALGLATVAAEAAAKQPELAALLARDAVHQAEQAPSAIKDPILAYGAVALAASAPDEAATLLGQMADEIARARALADVALAMAPHHPDRAVALLRSSDHPEMIERAWPDVIHWQARTDPAGARALVAQVLERYLKTKALLAVYDAVAEQASADAPAQPGGQEQ